MPRLSVPVLIAALLLAAPAAASAATVTYRGKTSQGRKDYLVTEADGRYDRFDIFYAARCTRTGLGFRSDVPLIAPFTKETATTFAVTRTKSDKSSGGMVGKLHASVKGHRTSDRAWRGTFSGTLILYRDGKQLDTCATGKVTWEASR